MSILKNDWAPAMEEEFDKPYYQQLRQFLVEEYKQKTIYPDMHDIFNALHFTPLSSTKVVILGQEQRMVRARHLLQDRIRELLVNPAIVLPIGFPECRPNVRQMAQRPQPFVGEPEVVALFLLFGQPDPP